VHSKQSNPDGDKVLSLARVSNLRRTPDDPTTQWMTRSPTVHGSCSQRTPFARQFFFSTKASAMSPTIWRHTANNVVLCTDQPGAFIAIRVVGNRQQSGYAANNLVL
jgi:hypothetical protein